ncbi:hypothetical protein QBC34DRAFT_61156 [Podospora aff. communis PSN243]|uniref:Uncharacterized protein n=1 Tax=Podospora aff. communis PSN243 TaxID=3040156 RepID=A0AAV9GRG0_9PEZI|nr:hypothetical protein QBC34DRAFT_61156 [Podospora aff. communis PSN243]
MDFGFGLGPSDMVLLGRVVYQASQQLTGEAVEDYKECARTCRRFTELVTLYEPLLVLFPAPAVRGLYRDVHIILRKFLRKIKCYKPLLGRNRKRWSFRSALAKLRWPVHSRALRQLSRDLQDKIQLINSIYFIQTIQFPQSNPFLHQPRPSRFILEDASGRVKSMPFSDVGTWDDLQQYLVRLYPGLAVIESKSYIFNNTTIGRDILPSSPLIRPLREVVADDERLVMSVILPLGGYLTKRYLKCSRRCDLLQDRAEATCRRCGRWVKIHDSFDDEADSLTKVALDTIRAGGTNVIQPANDTSEGSGHISGLRAFVETFLDEVEALPDSDERSRTMVKRKISAKFPKRKSPSLDEIRLYRKVFRRFRLCSPHWPDFSVPGPLGRAEDQLRNTMRGVDRANAILSQRPDAPFDAAAWAIGAFHQRPVGHILQLITSVRKLYEKRRWSHRVSVMTRHMQLYSDFAQEQPYPFEPAALRVRCLLWTLVEMRQLEAKLITHLVQRIKHSGLWVPPEFQRPTTPLAYKLLTIPHIMLLPVWRCTFDLADDVGQAIANHLFPDGPPTHLAALLSVLVGSESVSYDRVLDGNSSNCHFGLLNLDPTSKSALSLKEDVLEEWKGRYQNALEEFVVLATD